MADIDLNADLAESFGVWRLGDDEAMLEVVTSANLACGFHAGDPRTILATVQAAARRGVVIGAQVGYRDLAGFGRRFIDVSASDLTADILYQLGALDGLCRAAGTRVAYLKPHGALYNAVVHHEEQARALVDAIVAYDERLPLLGLPGSVSLQVAEARGVMTVCELFADRGYRADGTLVPRSEPGALVTEAARVSERVVRAVLEGELDTVDGGRIGVDARSVCVHGDTPGAVALARAVRSGLEAAGVALASFAQGR